MIFAYADPPYMNQARRHYKREKLCSEVNHRLLINYLTTFEAWALSCSSPSLPFILPMCPASVRVMAWVKPFCSFKPGVNPAYAWEPVIFSAGRKIPRTKKTVRDFVSCNITLKKGLSGCKPAAFCDWLFECAGLEQGDELVDVFPGTGAVSQQWALYRQKLSQATDCCA